MTIYEDNPVRALLEEAAKQLPPKFSRQDVVRWFVQNYPLVKKNTVTNHIISCCVNDRNRKHYPWRKGKDVLYKRDDGFYEKYNRVKHGLFDSEGIPVAEIQAEKS